MHMTSSELSPCQPHHGIRVLCTPVFAIRRELCIFSQPCFCNDVGDDDGGNDGDVDDGDDDDDERGGGRRQR